MSVEAPITAYAPAGCGDAGGAQVLYTALGDFPQLTPAAEALALGSTGATLAVFPAATRQVVITPLTPAALWAGAALVPDAGSTEVLVLPMARACPLSTPVSLATDPGVSIGMMDPTHAMLVGGSLPPFVVDLGNGKITQLTAALSPPRDYVSVTPFGAGVLLAGGEDVASGEVQDTAVVYTPAVAATGAGTFGSPIVLPSGQRTEHASVVLADGRVLLIGGASSTVSGAMQLVTGIDVLDPSNPSMPTALGASLHQGRVRPTVLALPNGNVFIGGGFDASMNPVASVEWLTPDLTWLGTQPLCSAALEQGFAATEGGAVLAVMGESATAGCSNVHLVLPPPVGVKDAPPLTPAPLRVRMFQGAQGSPLLLTDTIATRWNPWSTTFTSLGSGAAGLNLPTRAVLAPTPGLALWLADDENVWALRFDTHGEYATDVAHGPYLVTDDLFTAPDQLPGPNVSFTLETGARLTNHATAWVTDATFADVTASVTLPQGGAVTFVLRDSMGNEVTCAATDAPVEGTVQVVRSGASVSASVGDAGAVPCAGTVSSDMRVSVGVRAPSAGTARVRALAVQR